LRSNITFYLPFWRTWVHLQILVGSWSNLPFYHPSGAYEFTPLFLVGSCYSVFSFMCMCCRSLFVLLYFRPSCCLLFFDLEDIWLPLWYLLNIKSVKIWRKKTLLMAESCSYTWWIFEGLVWYSYGIYQPQQSLNVQDICCCNQRQNKILTCVPNLF